jgi:hypothetical protein
MSKEKKQKPEIWQDLSRIGLIFKSIFFKLPMIGTIKDRYFSPCMSINNKKFSKSFSMPTVLKIVIDNNNPIPGKAGELVNNRFFQKDPAIFFKVSFSCGKSGIFSKGKYTDPLSHWFNVFFGYYEVNVINAAKNAGNGWTRPFGYNSSNNTSDINFYDLARIAKADWNYFSNFMYGVPLAEVRKNDTIDLNKIKSSIRGKETIGRDLWDCAEIDNLDVVSAYTASGDAGKIDNPSIFSPAWRICFGRPHPRPGYDRSFITTNMKGKFYMRFKEDKTNETDEPVYTTYIFGGTINHSYDKMENGKEFNEEFLEEQIKSAKKVIIKYFQD